MAMATACLMLDDNVGIWERVGLPLNEGRVCRTHIVCDIPLDVRSTLLTFTGQGDMRPECLADARA